MTQPEELTLIKTLRDKIDELKVENENLEDKLSELSKKLERSESKLDYNRGVIDGLVFSIRCNGVSGNEISDPGLPWC